YSYTVCNRCPIDPSDKCFSLCPGRADADGFRLVSTSVADIDIVVARSEIVSGSIAQCKVAVAIVVNKRVNANGRVVVAGVEDTKRSNTDGRVVAADKVLKEREGTDGRVAVAGSIADERNGTVGCI